MSADTYLMNILAREAVDNGPESPVRLVASKLDASLRKWAGQALVSVEPSGSFAKGTANRSGTDIDLFISLSHGTSAALREIYNSLYNEMDKARFSPKKQNVSVNVKVSGYDVDLVPAKQQDAYSQDHSLYRRRADTWTKTNVRTHIGHVQRGGRLLETRVLKLWRNQKGIDFPSFYLELTTIAALQGNWAGLSDNVWTVFRYLRDTFANARVIDPANTNNVISDDLSAAERARVKQAAEVVLSASDWSQIVT